MHQDDELKPEGEIEEGFSADIFEEAVEDFGEEPVDDELAVPFHSIETEEDDPYEFFGEEDERDSMY